MLTIVVSELQRYCCIKVAQTNLMEEQSEGKSLHNTPNG